MKGNSYRKGTYHIGYAYITKKTAHKKARAKNKKASKEDWKKIKKNFQKPLDKSLKMLYNKITVKER